MKKVYIFLLGILVGVSMTGVIGIGILSKVTENDWYCPKEWFGIDTQE